MVPDFNIREVDDPCSKTDGSVEPINGFLSIHIRQVDDPCSKTGGSPEPTCNVPVTETSVFILSCSNATGSAGPTEALERFQELRYGGPSITDPTVQWGPQCVGLPKSIFTVLGTVLGCVTQGILSSLLLQHPLE